jgi:mRNA-degrading endonuclease YafQ of YafQ-DinJ toxin-antitoxin module
VNLPLSRTTAFDRALRRLLKRQPALKEVVEKGLERLSADCHDPTLKTHKLRGPLAGRLSCSIGYDLRLLFRIIESEGTRAILLLMIGTHDDVY